MTLTETIDYDFTRTVRHGIYRDIPVWDELASGEQRHYGVEVTSVLMDGAPVPYETGPEESYLRVRIGDPEEFVTGVHEYVIEYRVTGALRAMTAEECRVDRWRGRRGRAVLELRRQWLGGSGGRGAGQRHRACGPRSPSAASPAGTAPMRPARRAPQDGRSSSARCGCPPESALTGAAAWPGSAFTTAVVQDVRPGPAASARRGALIGGIAGIAVIAVMIGLAFALRRRDRGVSLPLAPPIYGPPCGLAPAEMLAAREGVASTPTSLLATLLDLAARGWVRFRVLGDEEVALTRLDAGTGELRSWEATLLEALFGERSTATLGEYDPDLTDRWTLIGIKLVDAAEAGGYRNAAAGRPDRRWLWFGIAGAGMALVSLGWLFFGGAALIPVAGAVLGSCLVVGSVAATMITPRTQTATSARFLSEVAGLEKVLGTDPAASRQAFAQASGLSPAAIMATMLPYAVALGLESAWVGAFPDLAEDELAGVGLDLAGTGLLSVLLSSAANSSSAAMREPPPPSSPTSSSGGSGLSGGGYAGGGGGGGGGGSW